MKKITNIFSSIFCLLAISFFSSFAHAHYLWLCVENPYPKVGQKVGVEVGWGHRFPKDEIIKEGWLRTVYALDPNGKKIYLKKIDRMHFTFVPKSRGTYILVSEIKPGFKTKTVEGFKFCSKKGLKNVISCFRYERTAKSLIAVGKSEKGFLNEAKTPLELVPLINPKKVKLGGYFPIKLLFKGKPLSHVYIYATYEGFSQEGNTFAYTTMTDRNGIAKIKILKKGKWMVKADYKIPYPDPRICDEYFFATTFTFEIE